MINKTHIQFCNNLIIEKRDMNVYHHNDKSIHLISHGNSIKIPLQSTNQKDYIHLSVAVGPGYMERENIVDLPSWLNYEFLSEGRFAAYRSDHRTLLKIPAGLPEWKLKLTLSQLPGKSAQGRVTISDNERK